MNIKVLALHRKILRKAKWNQTNGNFSLSSQISFELIFPPTWSQTNLFEQKAGGQRRLHYETSPLFKVFVWRIESKSSFASTRLVRLCMLPTELPPFLFLSPSDSRSRIVNSIDDLFTALFRFGFLREKLFELIIFLVWTRGFSQFIDDYSRRLAKISLLCNINQFSRELSIPQGLIRCATKHWLQSHVYCWPAMFVWRPQAKFTASSSHALTVYLPSKSSSP